MSLRPYFLLLALAAFVIAGGTQALAVFQSQRAQISVNIQVNVTPAPLAYNGPGAPFPLNIALQSAQSALRVQAVVSPNPNATLLYYNNPQFVINQTAGTTATYTCAYTVTVDKTSSAFWNLYDGLSSDFSGSSFPGSDLSNNTYVQAGSPNPKATPFVVYPDNNNSWFKRASATAPTIYCVDLTLAIPSSVPGGAYSTNAVYTLYF